MSVPTPTPPRSSEPESATDAERIAYEAWRRTEHGELTNFRKKGKMIRAFAAGYRAALTNPAAASDSQGAMPSDEQRADELLRHLEVVDEEYGGKLLKEERRATVLAWLANHVPAKVPEQAASSADYMGTFNAFWRRLVTNPNGTLNPDAVARELHDFSTLIHNASRVYDHVTGGKISKVNTLPEVVIAVADDECTKAVDEALKEQAEIAADSSSTALPLEPSGEPTGAVKAMAEYAREMEQAIPGIVEDVKRRDALAADARTRVLTTPTEPPDA